MKNILITSAGKRVVLVEIFQKTLKSIGAGGAVFTTDINPGLSPASIISDKSFKVSPCKEQNYLNELLDLCIKNNVGIIIPTIDTELSVLSENQERFRANGIEIVVSAPDFVKVCRDKRKTECFLDDLGIPCPKPVDKYHPVFPMFAKPYDGSLSTNLHVIRKEEDLTREILEDPKLIFMEYIDKKEYKEFTVDMYYGKDNLVKCIVPRERIEIRAGEINKGITRKNYIVGFLKERMGVLKGVRGCICIQLFYRESDNDIKGIEINPRFGGGYPLSYYAKANYAEYIIREFLMGEAVDYSEDWLDNTLMLRYDNDVIVYDAKA
jgi:carbamoyl-phosphate synthase large subunit